MKVLFVSNLYPPAYIGGYELNCADVAQELRARGHEVLVLTSTYRSDELPEREPGILRHLKMRQGWLSLQSKTTILSGIRNARAQWNNVRALRRVVTQFEPTIIVCWNAMHLGHSLPIVLEQSAPTLYSIADPWILGLLPSRTPIHRSRWRAAYHKILATIGLPDGTTSGKHLIFCSHSLQNQAESLGAQVIDGHVIHPGITIAGYDERPQHILQHNDSTPYKILFFGQIIPAKGVGTAVAALKHLRAIPGFASARLTLVGGLRDADYGNVLRAQIQSLGLTEAVEILPGRPRAEIVPLFDEHDVLVFPSEWYEPFGLSLVEAMAVGLPVVATSRGGPREIVRHGETGLIFQVGDPNDLAQQLAKMLRDPQYAARLGAAAAREVRARFTIAQQTSAFEHYMTEMLHDHGRR